MSAGLTLAVRTPLALLFDGPVRSIRAEDLDGWFGIWPGRRDIVAAMPPGILLFEDAEGDGFVALTGGLLSLRKGRCRVMAPKASLARDVEQAAERLAEWTASQKARSERQRSVLDDLEREALRRAVREAER